MKSKQLIFILLSIITLCQYSFSQDRTKSKGSTLVVKSLGQLEFPLIKNQRIQAKLFRVFPTSDTTSTIGYYDYNTTNLFLQQVSHKGYIIKTDTINITNFKHKTGYKNLLSYTLINTDSILLFFNPAYGNKYYTHDSALYLVNHKSNLIKIISMNDVNVSTWNKVKENDFSVEKNHLSNPYFLDYRYSTLTYNAKKREIFINLKAFSDTKANSNIASSIIGFLNIDSEKFSIADKSYFSSLNYPSNLIQTRHVARYDEDFFLTGYGFTNRFNCYSTSKNQFIRSVDVAAAFLDSIKPFTVEQKTGDNFSEGQFQRILYHPRLKKYINVYQTKAKNDNSEYDNKIIMQYIDSSFIVLGEMKVPSKYWENFQPFGSNFLVFDEATSIDRNKLVFDIVDFNFDSSVQEFNKENIEDLTGETPENSFKKLISDVTQKQYREFVFINYERSCKTCITYLNDYLKTNYHWLKNTNVAFMIVSSSKEQVIQNIGDAHQMDNLFILTPIYYKKYLPELTHFKHVVMKSGGSISIEQFQPSNMHVLYNKINKHRKK